MVRPLEGHVARSLHEASEFAGREEIPQVHPDSEILSVADELGRKVRSLQESSSMLREELGSVLPAAGTDSKRDSSLVEVDSTGYSPLGSLLFSYVQDIQQINERIVWILDNLRV